MQRFANIITAVIESAAAKSPITAPLNVLLNLYITLAINTNVTLLIMFISRP